MGLRKLVSWKGMDLEYWNVFQRAYNKLQDKSGVWVTAYKDKATRDADLNNRVPESTKMFTFVGDVTTEQAYALIKQHPDFTGATDWQ